MMDFTMKGFDLEHRSIILKNIRECDINDRTHGR